MRAKEEKLHKCQVETRKAHYQIIFHHFILPFYNGSLNEFSLSWRGHVLASAPLMKKFNQVLQSVQRSSVSLSQFIWRWFMLSTKTTLDLVCYTSLLCLALIVVRDASAALSYSENLLLQIIDLEFYTIRENMSSFSWPKSSSIMKFTNVYNSCRSKKDRKIKYW